MEVVREPALIASRKRTEILRRINGSVEVRVWAHTL
jgi:hypothetical protein